MDNNLQKIIDLRVEKTIKALEKNCMKGYYVKSESELISLIDNLIADDKLITAGGSMTLTETGVTAHLNEKYKGDLLQGKTFTVDPITHRRLENMGEEQKYLIQKKILITLMEQITVMI